MVLLLLLDGVSAGVPVLTLVGALVLTVWDCRARGLPFKQTAWWFSLTLLLHAFGYLLLRLWLVVNRPAGTEAA